MLPSLRRDHKFGGDKSNPSWLPVIDIARNTSWELLGLSCPRNGRPAQFFRCKCGSYRLIEENVARTRMTTRCRECHKGRPFGRQKNKALWNVLSGMKNRCLN